MEVRPRSTEGEGVDSPLLIILSEDDEQWHESGVVFDAVWLDDLISVLQIAAARLKVQP